jgi:hypothetical protein
MGQKCDLWIEIILGSDGGKKALAQPVEGNELSGPPF